MDKQILIDEILWEWQKVLLDQGKHPEQVITGYRAMDILREVLEKTL